MLFICIYLHVVIFVFLNICMLVAQLCLTLCDPMDCVDCSPQAPLSMKFSRQEYWSGLPCPSKWDLSDPGIEPVSPVAPALQEDYC